MPGTREGNLKRVAKLWGIDPDEFLLRIRNGEKPCPKCKHWKPLTDYNLDSSRGDGRDVICRECNHVKEIKSTKGRISPMKGKTHTEASRKNMSEARKGNQNKKGKQLTAEQYARNVLNRRLYSPRGARNKAWKGGITPLNQKIRASLEYAAWRTAVFERDHYTCQDCGDNRGGNLRAHHIKPFALHPELRFEVSNGRTVCEDCHIRTHKETDGLSFGRIRNHARRNINRVGNT